MGVRRVLVLVVVVAAGCSGGSHRSAPPTPGSTTKASHAAQICEKAVPTRVVSSDATIVVDFRRTTIGTMGPTQRHRFPGLADGDFAAWCWTGSKTTYSVYEVAAEGQSAQKVGTFEGWSEAQAHGRPSIP